MSLEPQNPPPKNGYAVPGLDWDTYIKLRPTYPPSLFSRIYSYHASHSNTWLTLHDAGSGAGIAAEILASRFKKIHISDLSSRFLSAAQSRLPQLPTSNQFTFHESSAESMTFLPHSSCDAVTIFCAIHWIDTTLLWPQVARVLKPCGTFAAVYYNGVPAIVDNEEAQGAWEGVCASCTRNGLAQEDEAVRRAFGVVVTGLDSIRPAREWFEEGVVRVRINEELRAEGRLEMEWTEEGRFGFPGGQVGEGDEIVEERREEEWSRELTLSEMKGLVGTLAYPGPASELEPLYKKVEEAMREKGQERVKVVWSAHLLLATRKSG